MIEIQIMKGSRMRREEMSKANDEQAAGTKAE